MTRFNPHAETVFKSFAIKIKLNLYEDNQIEIDVVSIR